MAGRYRQELDAALHKVAAMSSDIRKIDFSRWPVYASGAPKICELQNDRSYVAIRDIDGWISMTLASLELVLSSALEAKDPVKAGERFAAALMAGGTQEGYYTDGSLSAGVLDTAIDVGIVEKAEAEVLRAKRPWWGKVTPAQSADYVDGLVETIRTICERIESSERA